MAEESTILRRLLEAARVKDPSLTQEKFAVALSAIAAAKGYRGHSSASVSTGALRRNIDDMENE
jgi:hypothetical protein